MLKSVTTYFSSGWPRVFMLLALVFGAGVVCVISSVAFSTMEATDELNRIEAERARRAGLTPAERAREDSLAAARAERVRRFGEKPTQSAWDGSYMEVQFYLEDRAKDPGSVEIHRCTEVYHSESGWLVGCDWGARNGFGGMAREYNWFTIRHERVVAIHPPEQYGAQTPASRR